MIVTYNSLFANGRYIADKLHNTIHIQPSLWVIISNNAQIGLWERHNVMKRMIKYYVYYL